MCLKRVIKMKLSYYAVFEYDNDDICISFPDLPPALTCADNETDGKKYAKEAMDLALDGMCTDEAPSPSSAAQITLNENQKLFLITTELEVKNGKFFGPDVIEFNDNNPFDWDSFVNMQGTPSN